MTDSHVKVIKDIIVNTDPVVFLVLDFIAGRTHDQEDVRRVFSQFPGKFFFC